MSLSFTEKTKNLLAISGYIAAGGIGSLLILFLIRKSLSFDRQSAQKYHRQIQIALQEVHKLDKDLLTLQYRKSKSRMELKAQIDNVDQAIADLQEIPEFLAQSRQEPLKINLENQESLLTFQYGLIYQLQDSHLTLIQSCSKTTSFKQQVTNNQNILGDRKSVV